MIHRKKEHIQYVQDCRDGRWCKLDQQCWYKHSNNSVENEIQEPKDNNENMMKCLFDIMEKYGERIEGLKTYCRQNENQRK